MDMHLLKTVVPIGLESPVKCLHLTDTHFCLSDDTDPPRVREMAASRRAAFEGNDPGCIQRCWDEAVSYARQHRLPILHTGDLIDFLSHGNAVYAEKSLQGLDVFFAVGNHEFCHYVGEAEEDLAYKMEQLPKIQPFLHEPLLFSSRVIGGINFVAVDDGYYLFTDWQRERLEYEAKKGLPVVLMLHNPLHTDALYSFVMNEGKQPCAYLTGTPEAMMDIYPPDRLAQQRPDAPTLRFIDYVLHEPAIRAVVAGHLHASFEGPLPSGVMQYVTDGLFRGCAREITFI